MNLEFPLAKRRIHAYYEWFVGKRYLFSARQDRSISIITWISICGVALGVTALIVVTSP